MDIYYSKYMIRYITGPKSLQSAHPGTALRVCQLPQPIELNFIMRLNLACL